MMSLESDSEIETPDQPDQFTGTAEEWDTLFQSSFEEPAEVENWDSTDGSYDEWLSNYFFSLYEQETPEAPAEWTSTPEEWDNFFQDWWISYPPIEGETALIPSSD